jgi:hypothetical protein
MRSPFLRVLERTAVGKAALRPSDRPAPRPSRGSRCVNWSSGFSARPRILIIASSISGAGSRQPCAFSVSALVADRTARALLSIHPPGSSATEALRQGRAAAAPLCPYLRAALRLRRAHQKPGTLAASFGRVFRPAPRPPEGPLNEPTRAQLWPRERVLMPLFRDSQTAPPSARVVAVALNGSFRGRKQQHRRVTQHEAHEGGSP